MAYRSKNRRSAGKRTYRGAGRRSTARPSARGRIARVRQSRQRVELIIRSGPAVSEVARPFIPGAPGLAQVDVTNKRARF